MPPPAYRTAAVVSAFVLSAVCAFAVVVVRHGGGGHVPPPGRCEVSSTRALTSEAGDRVVGLAPHDGSLWALSVHRVPGGATAQLLRSASGRAASVTVASAPLPSGATAAGPLVVGSRVAFVTAARAVVRVTSFDGGAARSIDLPRGEQPTGRDARTPRLALDAEADGTLTVAAHWGSIFGTRRLHERDTRESPGLGPLRRDRFDAPAITVVNADLLLVQERRLGTFVDDAASGHALEAVAFPAAPFDVAVERTATLSTALDASSPRVASTGAAAVATWREGGRLLSTRLTAERDGLAATSPPVEVLGRDAAHHDLAATTTCALSAFDRAGSIVVRPIDARGATLTVGLEATAGSPGAVTDLRVARAGQGFIVVAVANAALVAWRISVDATCAPSVVPLALPTASHPALRLIAVAGDATGATVLSTHDPVDASETLVTRVDVDANAVVGATVRERVPQSVVVGTRQDARIALVAGPSRGTVRVQRLGDAGDDDEPGEDVLLRLARGERLALVASIERHRIWVADRSDAASNAFHPPHSVVLHSVIDTLEDGPRTEVATGAPPEAAFGSLALHRFEPAGAASPAWALVTAPDPSVTPALEGPWVFLFDATDHPVARRIADGSPFAHAAPLLPAALRSSRDRVEAVAWWGSVLAAIVSGPRAGVRLVTGDPFVEGLRDVALTATAPTMVRGATVLPTRDGWIAFWLDVTHPTPTLHDRRFELSGAPHGVADQLGEFLRLDEGALGAAMAAAVTAPDEFAVAVPTPHGVRLAEVRCSR
jgi:hypothetical protein